MGAVGLYARAKKHACQALAKRMLHGACQSVRNLAGAWAEFLRCVPENV